MEQLACPALLRTVRNGDAMEAARDEVITAYRIQEFNLRARAERERRPRVAPRCARLPGPHGSRFCARHSGGRYITCVMEFLFFPSTAGGRAHRMARCSPRRAQRLLDGTCSIFAGTVVCHVVVGFIGTLRVSTAPTILRWA